LNAHDPGAYGHTVGADYDRLYPDAHLETEATVAAVARLASGGGEKASVLEFGIGTGRLALALVDQGFTVAGIEASAEMVEQLRKKPRAAAIDVVIGDFATTRVPGRFAVVLLTFNAIFALPDRDAQIACFENAARHLEPDGRFVVEAFVLRPEQLSGQWSILPRSVQHEHVELQLARYDPAGSRIERTLLHLRPDGVRLFSVADTYAWPGELDLMARAAGLRLRSRAGGWAGEPFDATSDKHVSIYERAEARPA
jgi:SAM-dependent methyltransferase